MFHSCYYNYIIKHISEFHIRMKPVFSLLRIKINKTGTFFPLS